MDRNAVFLSCGFQFREKTMTARTEENMTILKFYTGKMHENGDRI